MKQILFIVLFVATIFSSCVQISNPNKGSIDAEADSYLAKYKSSGSVDWSGCSDKEVMEIFDHLTDYANKGHVESMYYLAFMYQWSSGNINKDYDKSFYWYLKAAELGHEPSMKEVATSYLMGKNDWYCNQTKNLHKAEKWLLLLVDKGNVDALNDLGYLYHLGCGKGTIWDDSEDDFPPDINKAVAAYSQAANQGSAYAMYNLGELYKDEFHDAEKAMEWYDKAITQGSYDAAMSLGYLYFYGDEDLKSFPEHVNIDYKKALGYFNIALELSDDEILTDSAKENIANTFYELGRMYEFGLGCKESFSEAIKFYRLAAENGNEEAHERLELLTK